MALTVIVKVNIRAEESDIAWDLEVEPLGAELYRVAEIVNGGFSPIEIDLEYDDVVELAPGLNGVYEIRAVGERGRWRRFDYLLSKDFVESQAYAVLLQEVERRGGHWICEAGGCMTILLPPDSGWIPNDND